MKYNFIFGFTIAFTFFACTIDERQLSNAVIDPYDISDGPAIYFTMPQENNVVSTYATPSTKDITINDVCVIGVKLTQCDTTWNVLYAGTQNERREIKNVRIYGTYQGCDVVADNPHFITQLDGNGTQRQKLKLFNFIPAEGDYVFVACNTGVSTSAMLESKIGNPAIGDTICMHDLWKIDLNIFSLDGNDAIPFSGSAQWFTDVAAFVDMRFAISKVVLNVDPNVFPGKTVTFQIYNDSQHSCYFPYIGNSICIDEDSLRWDYVTKDGITGNTRVSLGDTAICYETLNYGIRTNELYPYLDSIIYYSSYYGSTSTSLYRDSMVFNPQSAYIEMKVDDGIQPEYYRIDFYDNKNRSFASIARGVIYTFNVTGVLGHGYTNRDECWRQAGSNIKFNMWSNPDNDYYHIFNTYNYGSSWPSEILDNGMYLNRFNDSLYIKSDETFSLETNGQYSLGFAFDAMLVYGNEGTYDLGKFGMVDPLHSTTKLLTNTISADNGITLSHSEIPLDTFEVLKVTLPIGFTSGTITAKLGNLEKEIPVRRQNQMSGEKQIFYTGKVNAARRIEYLNRENGIIGFCKDNSLSSSVVLNLLSEPKCDCYTHLSANMSGVVRKSEAAMYNCDANTDFVGKNLKVVFMQGTDYTPELPEEDVISNLIVSPWVDGGWLGHYVFEDINFDVTPMVGDIRFTSSTPPFTALNTVTINFSSPYDVWAVEDMQTGWLQTVEIPNGTKTGSIVLSYKNGEQVCDIDGNPIESKVILRTGSGKVTRRVTIKISPVLP